MKKMISFLLIVLIAGLALSACQPAATPAPAAEAPVAEAPAAEEPVAEAPAAEEPVAKTKVIGVSLYTRDHTFYNALEDAVVAEAAELGYEVIIVDAKKDTNTQINQVQDFITQKVDAMILCPTNSAGIAPAIKLANEAGIPIFTMDIAAESGVVSHIATDNYAGGVLAGQFVADYLEGKGEVAVLACPSIESVTMREEGFSSVIAEYPDMEVVAVTDCACDGGVAANQTQDLLITYPNLAAVFGAGDPFALGALASITAAKMDVYVMGFDGLPEGVAEVNKGGLFIGDVAQDPDSIGRTTVDTLDAYLNGETVEPLISIAPYVITKK